MIIYALIGIMLLVLLIGGAVNWVRSLRAQGETFVRERFPNARLIVPSANFMGQESLGALQLRGNGTLAITEQELFFKMWVTQRELHIPLAQIEKVENVRSYLGKSVGMPLLKVSFQNSSGAADSAAWYLHNLEEVKQLLVR